MVYKKDIFSYFMQHLSSLADFVVARHICPRDSLMFGAARGRSPTQTVGKDRLYNAFCYMNGEFFE